RSKPRRGRLGQGTAPIQSDRQEDRLAYQEGCLVRDVRGHGLRPPKMGPVLSEKVVPGSLMSGRNLRPVESNIRARNWCPPFEAQLRPGPLTPDASASRPESLARKYVAN